MGHSRPFQRSSIFATHVGAIFGNFVSSKAKKLCALLPQVYIALESVSNYSVILALSLPRSQSKLGSDPKPPPLRKVKKRIKGLRLEKVFKYQT